MALIRLDKSTMILEATVTDDLGNPVNSAAVEVTLTDGAGTALAGAAWPVALTATGADGKYTYELPHDLATPRTARARVRAVFGGKERWADAPILTVTDAG